MSTPEEPVPATPARPLAAAEALKLDSPVPLRLLMDWEIREQQAQLVRAQEAARRLAHAEPPEGAQRVAQRLADQGAAPELVDRARNTAREDRLYAREQSARAHARAERLHKQTEQTGAELHRRQQLTPAQQQAEAAERMKHRSVHSATSNSITRPTALAPQPADPAHRKGQSR
ncbi:hypothetical protein [Streptomyces marianii]|uniref:Uncharacterized protein n=1 Tax=Streptomyces marianii TaxID=1817406 RepID=A0A5R9DR17_9ACTN|nr:hypothetical protein [Streptomyces marianii]TLQ38939.1 hypothetical protein FEF34_39650 [Streptomyces marianii]